ncbi:TLC domain-containing protein 5-like [Bolinopsis microptera]|uniref:TLC domain-containing protein 5-like n=1 Tax=Bolinopsis microptera TaxID=2820187 RepID=UPI003078C4A3
MIGLTVENLLPYLIWEAGAFPFLQVFVCVILWALTYCLLRVVLHNRSAEYCCRLVTCMHGFIVACVTGIINLYIGPAPWDVFGTDNTTLQNAIVIISLAYFIFDFTWCCIMGAEGLPMLAHHVVSLFILSYCLYNHRFGAEVTAVCFGAEVTNPLLQMRWFLREHKQYDTVVGNINDYIFVFSFAFWRFIPGTYLLYRATTSPKVDIVVKTGAVLLYLISIVFMHGVGKFFLRKYVWKMKKPAAKED